jgi:AdoMet-dependent heme synthase
MSKKIVINHRVGWRSIDGGIVLFNCDNQQIMILNETASNLWEKLAICSDVDALVEFLINEYDISKDIASRDVSSFIDEISSQGFVGSANAEGCFETTESQNDSEGENVLLAIEMQAIEKLIPFAITFETTFKCNEHCVHCYMSGQEDELDLNQIKSILDQMAMAGCLFVSFTGGEFFSRKDACDIIEHAGKMHFVIDILSNGTLIDKRTANFLAKYPVRRVQLSLYGATPQTHDGITRVTGSHTKTLSAIRFLKNAEIKIEIAFPLMDCNFHERHEVKKLVKSLGCLLSPTPIITARNDGSRDTHDFRLNDEQMRLFFSDVELSSLYAGRKPFSDHLLYFGFKDLRNAAPCYCGFNSCAITPAGKVLPCNQLLYEVGDLKKNSFLEIWENAKLKALRALTIGDLPKCSICEHLSSCARCPGLALLEGGGLLDPSPENCRIVGISREFSMKGGDLHG